MYFLFYLRTQILPIDSYVLNSKSAAFQSIWLKFGQSDAIYLFYKTVSANFNNPFHFKARAFFPQGVLTILPSSTSFFEMHDKMADARLFALIFLVLLTVLASQRIYFSFTSQSLSQASMWRNFYTILRPCHRRMPKSNCDIFHGMRCHVLLWILFVASFVESSAGARIFTTITMLLCLFVLLYLSNPTMWNLILVHVKSKHVQSRLWFPGRLQHGSIHVPSVQNPCAQIRKGSFVISATDGTI